MTETGYFLLGFLLCVIVTFGIIAIIHKKLFVLLTDLCEGEARAWFWTNAIEVWFFLYSISSALRWCPEGRSDRQLFFANIHQIKDGLKGMSNAIIMLSAGLLVFVLIRKFKGHENNAFRREDT